MNIVRFIALLPFCIGICYSQKLYVPTWSTPNFGKGAKGSLHNNRVVTWQDYGLSAWNGVNGEEIFTSNKINSPIFDASIHPTGEYLLSIEEAGFVKIWDINQKTLITSVSIKSSTKAAFMLNKHQIGFIGRDGNVYTTDFTKNKEVKILNVEGESVNSILFSPNEKQILLIKEKRVELWNLETKEKLFETPFNARSAKFNTDGKYIVISSNVGYQILNCDSKTLGNFINENFVSEKNYVVTNTQLRYIGYNIAPTVVDLETGKKMSEISIQNPISLSSDGNLVVSRKSIFNYDTVCVNDLNSGNLLYCIVNGGVNFEGCEFVDNGKYILTMGSNNIISLRSVESGVEENYFSLTEKLGTFKLFTQNGKSFVVLDKIQTKEQIKIIVKIVNSKSLNTERSFDITAYISDPEKTKLSNIRVFSDYSGGRIIIYSSPRVILNLLSGEIVTKTWDYPFSSVTFSSNNKYILLQGNRSVILNSNNDELLFDSFDYLQNVVSGYLSNDGTRVVLSTTSEVKIYDIAEKKELAAFKVHDGNINSIEFDPHDKFILTASTDKTIRLWESNNGMLLRSFTGHTDNVMNASFSPNGKYILSVSADRTVKIWDSETGKTIHSLALRDTARIASFTPNNDRFYVVHSNVVDMYDWLTLRKESKLRASNEKIVKVNVSSDNNTMETLDIKGGCRVWNIESKSLIAAMENPKGDNRKSAFSNMGRYIAVLSGNYVAVYEAGNYMSKYELKGHTGTIVSCAFSIDDSYLVTGSNDKTVKIWDMNNGKEVITLVEHKAAVASVKFTPDDKFLLTTSYDGTAKIWDVLNWSLVKTLTVNEDIVERVVFNKQGDKFMTIESNNNPTIWDLKSMSSVISLNTDTHIVRESRFSHDGMRVATSNWGREVRIWDAITGKQISSYEHPADVTALEYSENGKLLLTTSSDETLTVWDVNEGVIKSKILGYEVGVPYVPMQVIGDSVLAACLDSTVRFIDYSTGNIVTTVNGHKGKISSAMFDNKGQNIVTSGSDGITKVWGKNSFVSSLPDDLNVAVFNSSEEISLFPNPTHNQLNITLPSLQRKYWYYNVLNEEGQAVCKGTIEGMLKNQSIEFPQNIQSGCYMFLLYSNENIYSGKFIVNR